MRRGCKLKGSKEAEAATTEVYRAAGCYSEWVKAPQGAMAAAVIWGKVRHDKDGV